jgi:hypothetical protein
MSVWKVEWVVRNKMYSGKKEDEYLLWGGRKERVANWKKERG